MRPRRWVMLGAALAVLIGAVTVIVARSASGVPLPSSMASTGDSITRAFDLDLSHVLVDAPQDSWSTGSDPAVDSQYQRILTAHAGIAGRAFNDARSGAVMADLDGQVKAAAGQGVQYLTVLMGANDLCTGSPAGMTPTATFRSEFSQALADFFRADPRAHVLVSSIPDLFQLWTALHDNPLAGTIWAVGHLCQSMLAVPGTDAQRRQVVQQEAADNAALASVCHRYTNCKWDNYAVYHAQFTVAAVSDFDYFHPSPNGQKRLAAVTWAAGYWPTTP